MHDAQSSATSAIAGTARPVIALQVDDKERRRALDASEDSWHQPEPDQRPEYEADTAVEAAAEDQSDPAAAILNGQ